jgi:hypothetical protein
MPYHNFKFLDLIINKKYPDHVRIRYYPSCNNANGYTNTEKQAVPCSIVKDLSDEDMTKLKIFLKSYPCASGTFTEYGIKDTFIRISNINNSSIGDSRMFFRREIHMFSIGDFSGIFVIEMYKMCDEEDLPHIVNYQYNTNFHATTYTIEKDSGDMRICFTKVPMSTKDGIDNTDQLKESADISFTDINQDLDISTDLMGVMTVANSINKFIDDVASLRNKLKLGF